MVPDSLERTSVLMVLVDLAEGPLSSVGSMPQPELRASSGVLAELCVLLDLPVIIARAPLPHKAGSLLPEIAIHSARFTSIDHATNDSWETPAFVEAVRSSGRRQLIFAGIATDVGVGLTALSAVRSGYQAAVLTDVSGTIDVRTEQVAFLRLAQAGVVLTTCSGFAGEVQRDYTQDKGPDVLKLVARSGVSRRQPVSGDQMTEEERHQTGLSKLQEIAGDRAAQPLGDWNRVAPDMQNYIVDFIAGDILSRPGLDSKTRQLATVAMLCALGHAPDEFRMHLGGALRLGWTQEELVEVLIQAAVFSGFPSSLNALKWAREVFDQDRSDVATSAAKVLIGKCQAADAAMDADAFVALLTPDVVFSMGSQPELKGRIAVREAVTALFRKLTAIQHRTIHIWEDGHQVCLRAEVTFRRKDGREFLLPYANVLTIASEGLISDYRIHIDISPMLSA